jgi:hypothetical protein
LGKGKRRRSGRLAQARRPPLSRAQYAQEDARRIRTVRKGRTMGMTIDMMELSSNLGPF